MISASHHLSTVDVTVSFPAGKQPVTAVRDASLSIRRGECFGIVGASGAGKSTLLRVLNLLERPTSGRVHIDNHDVTDLYGADLRQLRHGIGMVHQHFNLFGARTVAGNVDFPLRLAGIPAPDRAARVAELLDLVGLTDKAGVRPHKLSGGQKQRVGIARALANRPSILLCDEPTSALDPDIAQAILALLRDINQRLGITVIIITHSMDVVRSVCDRVAVMHAGAVVELGDVFDVFAAPHANATRQLLRHEGRFDLPDAVRQRHDVVVRLVYRGPGAADPVLATAITRFGLPISILHGRIDWIGGRALGVLLVGIDGEPALRQEVIAFLRAHIDLVEVDHGS